MLAPAVLKGLREKQGLSQEYVARELQISRPSFALMEQGKREPTLSQAEKLAVLLGITLPSLIAGNPVPISEVTIRKEEGGARTDTSPIRINMPQRNLKKFREMFLYILEKVGGKPNVGQTVLYKLFYFIDFDYYERFEDQLIGATYIRNHYGPTPNEFAKVAACMIKEGEIEEVRSAYFKHEQKKYLPRRSPDLSVFSVQEKEHIDEVLARLSDKSAAVLSDFSHTDTPWRIAKPGQVLEYEAVFYRDEAHSVREYEPL